MADADCAASMLPNNSVGSFMAELPTNVAEAIATAIFASELQLFQRSYRAALKALEYEEQEVEKSVRAALRLGATDEFPDGEDGDSDDLIREVYDRASESVTEIHRGATLVSKAFLIVLWHMWERHCNRRLKEREYRSGKVFAWLNAKGRTPDMKRLDQLRLAANCAKHGPGDGCRNLFRKRPDLFRENGRAPCESNLIIKTDVLNEFFSAVLYAGTGREASAESRGVEAALVAD